MRTQWTKCLLWLGAATAGLACSTNVAPPVGTTQPGTTLTVAVSQRAVCPKPSTPNTARCYAHILTDAKGNKKKPPEPSSPTGLGATDLQAAYNLPSTGGAGQTIAIVDAQDLPTAESDLATYRSQYNLPPCTSASGCFTKVNQTGQASPLPTADPTGWGEEIALDIEMASAACPSCKILLVEANSQADTDLGAAVNAAVALGATVVSNSYGWSETDANTQTDSTQYYNHPGVLITASSGDQAYDQTSDGPGVSFPAASPFVMSVGGTSLTQSTTTARGWVETAWDDAGSGCSTVFAKPSWQNDTGCSMRTVADVSAVADIEIAFYEDGQWGEVGGTSVASPFVAGVFALVGKSTVAPSFAWENTQDFYDVTSGSNGTCSPTYLCTAGPGYDGPTGWGTPNGEALLAASTGPSGSDAGADAAEDAGPDAGP
jgi:subtilase family serine protease